MHTSNILVAIAGFGIGPENVNLDLIRTCDLGGKRTTPEFTHALIARIANG